MVLAFNTESHSQARWVTADFKAGDIVVFPMKIMHVLCKNEDSSIENESSLMENEDSSLEK